MDASQWDKLRHNYKPLTDDVEAERVVPLLIQNGAVDVEISEMLKALPTNKQKMEKLLEVLKSLPRTKNAYNLFLDALRSVGLPDYMEMAAMIEKTPSKSDSSVRAKVNPSHCEDKVREVLHKNFASLEGQSTKINEIRTVLVLSKAFGESDWPNNTLTEFVSNLFVGVTVFKEKLAPKRSVICFNNLGRIVKDESCSDSSVQAACGSSELDVHSMTPSQLKQFLKEEFEKKKTDNRFTRYFGRRRA